MMDKEMEEIEKVLEIELPKQPKKTALSRF